MIANGLLVEYSEYAWLRDWAAQVAQDLQMPRVEIIITQNPVMNAYSFGFMRRYNIVLHSGTIRWLNDEQLKAIVVHEMAHIKYGHTAMGVYASIFQMVPIFGGIFGWLLGFWHRRAEYTCDRLALCYLRDPKLVKEALTAVHIGPDAAPSYTDVTQQWQQYVANNWFNQLTQTFSTHPFLWRRLQQIDITYHTMIAPPQQVPLPQAPQQSV